MLSLLPEDVPSHARPGLRPEKHEAFLRSLEYGSNSTADRR